ncbi:MAG: indolepyruvate ferredoxin oxidoreductase family protein, partial [Acetobacteraceae bacterium]
TQALARLPMVQRRRDAAAGLSTAGYVSGYRGSPLGGLDLALWQAAALTARHDIVFRPGVNEELAATAIWGTQQANAGTSARHDGVFALWYGKGPGVDRSGDAFKHGNAAGSARHGGVLLAAGDDHLAKSSTLPHQSDYGFIAAGIPVLIPSGIDEFVSFGVFGWAMSRFSGCWVGFRAVAAVTEGSASVDAGGPLAMAFAQPEVTLPPGGLHIRAGDDWNLQEARLYEFKLPAAVAFARANAIDRTVLDGGTAPLLGLLTGGKSFPDVIEALDLLGIDAARAGRIGLRLRKLGLAWPLEPDGLGDFADGIEEILVVEEKRPVIEAQVKERLYGRANAPRVLGKCGADGAALLPVAGELDPLIAAQAIGRRLAALGRADAAIVARLAEIERRLGRRAEAAAPALKRTPYFCSG